MVIIRNFRTRHYHMKKLFDLISWCPLDLKPSDSPYSSVALEVLDDTEKKVADIIILNYLWAVIPKDKTQLVKIDLTAKQAYRYLIKLKKRSNNHSRK